MIIAHYGHRLPADYNIGLIHARARERGPLWNAVPELYFKAFLLRESGRFGATTNSYSSLYLWRQDEAFRNFPVKGGYKIVVDLFGRAAVETRLTPARVPERTPVLLTGKTFRSHSTPIWKRYSRPRSPARAIKYFIWHDRC